MKGPRLSSRGVGAAFDELDAAVDGVFRFAKSVDLPFSWRIGCSSSSWSSCPRALEEDASGLVIVGQGELLVCGCPSSNDGLFRISGTFGVSNGIIKACSWFEEPEGSPRDVALAGRPNAAVARSST